MNYNSSKLGIETTKTTAYTVVSENAPDQF